jgi:hypothetical protein
MLVIKLFFIQLWQPGGTASLAGVEPAYSMRRLQRVGAPDFTRLP